MTYSQIAWVLIPPLPLARSVSLGKLANFFVSYFPRCKMKEIILNRVDYWLWLDEWVYERWHLARGETFLADISGRAGDPYRDCDETPKIAGVWVSCIQLWALLCSLQLLIFLIGTPLLSWWHESLCHIPYPEAPASRLGTMWDSWNFLTPYLCLPVKAQPVPTFLPLSKGLWIIPLYLFSLSFPCPFPLTCPSPGEWSWSSGAVTTWRIGHLFWWIHPGWSGW